MARPPARMDVMRDQEISLLYNTAAAGKRKVRAFLHSLKHHVNVKPPNCAKNSGRE